MRFKDDSYSDFYDDNETILESHNDDFVSGDGIVDQTQLLEAMICDRIQCMDENAREAYLASDEFHTLEEAGVVSKKTKVRLNRNDDLTRRLHLAALQKAREEGDADWEALRKNRIKERQLLNKIYQKYVPRVRNDVIRAQKRLVKISPKAFDTNKLR